MKPYHLILSGILLLSLPVFAENKYPVSEIPDSLKSGMYAVIREDQTVIEIFSLNKSVETVHRVVTILNEKAKSYAVEVVSYDKSRKISYFRGTAYDAVGKEIKKLKQSEIYDQSAISGFTLYEDDRIKRADLSQVTYPYTVEFEYQIQNDHLYSIPGFQLYSDDEVSIENINYSVSYPKVLTPRFKLTLMPAGVKSPGEVRETISWTFKNFKPKKFEPYSRPHSELIPNIKTAPSQFEYGGFQGNMVTWKEYGKWSNVLMEGRQELPAATKEKVIELTKGLATPELKVKAIYEFLQNKTRYVSIQEGIGGMQPFAATTVDNNGYGDCKALSNYMVSLLKVVGIKGYYTRIRAGENEPDIDLVFSSHQTNHVVVSVPNGKDTLWMECTSQTAPFNFMGAFTGDRSAVMIDIDGGKIVKTPVYTAEQNKQTRTAKVTVDVLGNAKAQVVTTYKGLQYENNNLSFILGNQFEAQKKWVQNNTDIPSFTINSIAMADRKNKIPSAIVKLDLTLDRYASVSGKRVFLSPNLMNKTSFIPQKNTQRKNEIVWPMNYTDIDTIIYTFPENLYPEFVPTPAKITSRFGEYETKFDFNEGKLVYIRKMKVLKGVYPKESYNELVEFYKSVTKADNIKLVFLNKT
ncbi:MAG: DUF3857 domain-containing transglutaminase family protein [Cyclobacteriaceae bacterium]|nr:DUF3857 domain-containing transglutaminase family protein [Cyclobacteriaceae bacterium]